jgi:hypothetical protein
MKRWRVNPWTAALLALGLLGSGHAAADSVDELSTKLLKGDDFRVRTQAALALGATGSERAVKPLCQGLKDSNDSVRAAVAAAFGKLLKGGADCLKKQLKEEKTDNVRKMLEKSLKLVEEAASGPQLSASTKLYISIGKIEDQTGRGGGEVDSMVRGIFRRVVSKKSGSALAPDGETADEARRRLRKAENASAYLLQPKVHKLDYSGGSLKVKIDVLIFSYPDRALQGEVSREGGMGGVAGKDVATENKLIQAVAESAAEEFGQMVSQLN